MYWGKKWEKWEKFRRTWVVLNCYYCCTNISNRTLRHAIKNQLVFDKWYFEMHLELMTEFSPLACTSKYSHTYQKEGVITAYYLSPKPFQILSKCFSTSQKTDQQFKLPFSFRIITWNWLKYIQRKSDFQKWIRWFLVSTSRFKYLSNNQINTR